MRNGLHTLPERKFYSLGSVMLIFGSARDKNAPLLNTSMDRSPGSQSAPGLRAVRWRRQAALNTLARRRGRLRYTLSVFSIPAILATGVPGKPGVPSTRGFRVLGWKPDFGLLEWNFGDFGNADA